MKNKIVLFITGCCALVLSSCLGSNDTTYELSKDCEILTFYLSNDSIEGLSDVVFTIDQVSGRIFNADSMPYGTVIDEKVICNMTLASTVMSCQAIQLATGDTVIWKSSEDSLDFSKPVKFINTLWDGKTTKLYEAQINIHQVVPDSMVWSIYGEDIVNYSVKNEKVIVVNNNDADYYYMYVEPANANNGYALYTSSVKNGKNWNSVTLTGLPAGKININQIAQFKDNLYTVSTDGVVYSSSNGIAWTEVAGTPKVKSILGALNVSDDYTSSGRQASALATIVDNNGVLSFASMDVNGTWKEGVTVYDGFPVSGFGNVSFNSMYRERLMVVGGKDKNNSLINLTWATEDGVRWALLTDEEADLFDKREGISVAQYDGGFFMVGGIDAAGKATKEIYRSKDGGVTWALSDTLVVMPQAFAPRAYMSVCVDENNFMYLFGGKVQQNTNVTDQIWRGRINRLGFANQ